MVLQTILFIILVFIALGLLVAAFSKKEYDLEREIIINRPQQEIYNYLKYLKNQEQFSKWVMTDPQMKKTFTGEDGQEGFIYAWNGNQQAGEGEQEIMQLTEGEKIAIEVRFKRPFAGVAYTPFSIRTIMKNQTKVTWGMKSKLKYPMNLMILFVEKMLSKDMDVSLENLKKVLEK
jgi:hypothetical protein